MAEEESPAPLLLSSRAALRLSMLLRQHDGSQPATPDHHTLAAALLDRPVELVQPGDATAAEGTSQAALEWAAGRDVLGEVAVTTRTLRALKVPAGTLVELRNASRPQAPPHLARLLPLPMSCGGHDGTAYLGPSLAHNLGFALHLRPLLGQQAGSVPADAAERVLLQRCTASAVPAPPVVDGPPTRPRHHRLLQPLAEPLEVPLAADVAVATVRRPTEVLLEMPPPHPEDAPPGSSEAAAAARRHQKEQQQRADEAAAEATAALEAWFLAAPRVVTQGDVLAVPRRCTGMAHQLLPNLVHAAAEPAAVGAGSSAAGAADAAGAAGLPQPEPELLYFQVTEVEVEGGEEEVAPAAATARTAVVDPRSTVLRMAGSCPAGLPVGLERYLLGRGSSSQPWQQSQVGEAAEAEGEALPVARQLARLLATALHPGSTGLPLRLAVLLHGPAGAGKRSAAEAAAAAVGAHVVSFSCHDVRAPAAAAEKHTLEALRAVFGAAADYRPSVLLLRHFQLLGESALHGGATGAGTAARAGAALAECIRRGFEGGSSSSATSAALPTPVVLVACAESADDVPAPLRRCFTHEFALDAPDQRQREALLRASLGQAVAEGADDVGDAGQLLEDSARHTAGLLPRELRAVAAEAAAAAAAAALPPSMVLQPAAGLAAAAPPRSSNGGLAPPPQPPTAHLAAAVDAVRGRAATDIGAPKIPDVRWEDVGGLEGAKRAVLDTVELPLRHPELFAGTLRRRSGVLFYGPPGTGKTLLAKAVATECSINFLSVKGPELINMYVGESERQIREVFARARRARPCVVFFDELDSLAPARGKGSDSGGVMDRVVAQLLAEIDGVQGGAGSNDVFIIGATNRPDLLDPALLRPGRLDKLLYVGIAADAPSRLKVLQALTRKFTLAPDVDLGEVAERCPGRFTGADMYALCSDAWMGALKRRIADMEQQEQKEEDGGGGAEQVVVSQADFLAAAAALTPSLSAEEIEKYEQIRLQWES